MENKITSDDVLDNFGDCLVLLIIASGAKPNEGYIIHELGYFSGPVGTVHQTVKRLAVAELITVADDGIISLTANGEELLLVVSERQPDAQDYVDDRRKEYEDWLRTRQGSQQIVDEGCGSHH